MVLGNSTEICGGPSRMTMFNYTLGWGPPTLPTGWSSIGCWTDAGSTRALGSYSFTSSSMTRELCMSTCLAKGYAFAGAEYSTECYCANSFALSSTSGATGCTMTCGGNTTETCGGPNRLTAYNYTLGIATTTTISAAAATSTALNVAVPRGWSYNGCKTEATSMRALSSASPSSSSMTNEFCMTSCQKLGYTLAGTEYSGECFCGNAFNAGSVASTACAMTCNGNSSQICGGPNLLSTWHFATSASVLVSSATASSSIAVASSSSAAASVAVANAKVAAVSSTSSTASSASSTSSSASSSTTVAESTTSSASTVSTPTASNFAISPASTVTTTTTNTASTVQKSTAAAPTGYMGCFTDHTTPSHHLNATTPSVYQNDTSMTNELCISHCAVIGYAFAGTESSNVRLHPMRLR